MTTTTNNLETTASRESIVSDLLDKALPTISAVNLLDDPSIITITVTQAAAIIGVSAATAHNAHKRTGELIAGVRVIRCGRRCVVSTAALRAALGRNNQI
jgi:hypothetical protein